jgi:hypothetical protein
MRVRIWFDCIGYFQGMCPGRTTVREKGFIPFPIPVETRILSYTAAET